MLAPPGNVLPSSLLALRWVPSLGVLLAIFGVVLVLAGMRDVASPMTAARLASGHNPSEQAMTVPITAMTSPRDVEPQDRVRKPNRPGELHPVVGWQSNTPSRYLAAEYARAGSTYPRTVPPHSDPREALASMAVAQQQPRWSSSRPSPNMGRPCDSLRLADSDDRIAAALFGPPVSSGTGEAYQGGPGSDCSRGGWASGLHGADTELDTFGSDPVHE
jgi:hypothetical protein